MGRRDREKLVRKNEIIKAARDLFLKNGFAGTSMDDIAIMSEFSKRTLYTYFTSKEEIYYAVLYLAIEKNLPSYEKAIKSEELGIKKLHAWCTNYYMCYRNSPEYYGFLSEIGNTNFKQKLSSQFIALFNEQSKKTRDELTKVFNLGIQDGSIRKSVDVKLSIKYLFKVMPAIIGEYIKEKNVNDDSFYQELELILSGLKN